MPTTTIPLAGAMTQRVITSSTALSASKDQRFINCLQFASPDDVLNNKSVFLEKRQGAEVYNTPSSGNIGYYIWVSPSTSAIISQFNDGSNNKIIFSGTTNCGSMGNVSLLPIGEAIFNGITYYLLPTQKNGAWFLPSDAVGSFTFTGDTHTNTTIDNISSMTGLYVGQAISGTGIQAATRIATINSGGSSITTTLATTATNAGITVTREGIAKIIDADFPSGTIGLCEMDGYVFTADNTNGRIYNSALNDITTWSADSYISANMETDVIVGVAKYKNNILALGSTSIEWFVNGGNSTGSILSRNPQSFTQIGVYNQAGYSQVNDIVFFIGQGRRNYGIFVLSEGTTKRISTPSIEAALVGAAGSIDAFSYAGYTYALVQGGINSFPKYLYCLELNDWKEIEITSNKSYHFSSSNTPVSGTTTYLVFISSDTSGSIYTWDSSPVFQDAGAAYTMTIQTEPKVLNKGKGFIINSIELLADTQSSGSSTLEVSRNDYAFFSTLGSFNLTAPRKRIKRGGYCRNHAIFRVTDSGNNAWRGQALVVDWTPCET